MSTDRNLVDVLGFACRHHKKMLKDISAKRKISMKRLVSFAIDNEIAKENKFEFDTAFPDDEVIEYAYADEAGKILAYLNTLTKGAGIDILLLMRWDMLIPDKYAFMMGLKDCVERGLVESFTAPLIAGRAPNADGYLHYRVAGKTGDKLLTKRTKDFKRYLQLKKRYENEGEL